MIKVYENGVLVRVYSESIVPDAEAVVGAGEKTKAAPAAKKTKKANSKLEELEKKVPFFVTDEEKNTRHEAAKLNQNAFGFSGIKVHLKEEDAPARRKEAHVVHAAGIPDQTEAA